MQYKLTIPLYVSEWDMGQNKTFNWRQIFLKETFWQFKHVDLCLNALFWQICLKKIFFDAKKGASKGPYDIYEGVCG